MKHEAFPPEAAADPVEVSGMPDDYTPVALRHRHDGWTAERQWSFLAALAETGCVSDACAAAGVTARSAYRLRARSDASAFATAWDQALLVATARLTSLAFERAARGTIREYWKNGELVGESRQPSDKLLVFLLQHLHNGWFGPKAGMRGSICYGAVDRFEGAAVKLADCPELAEPLQLRDYAASPPTEPVDPIADEGTDW